MGFDWNTFLEIYVTGAYISAVAMLSMYECTDIMKYIYSLLDNGYVDSYIVAIALVPMASIASFGGLAIPSALLFCYHAERKCDGNTDEN